MHGSSIMHVFFYDNEILHDVHYTENFPTSDQKCESFDIHLHRYPTASGKLLHVIIL